MNKLLKQLIQTLDENGVQVNEISIEKDCIKVNNEIAIILRRKDYALHTSDGGLDKTYYYSLTEALETLASYLKRLKVGDVLVSKSGEIKFKIVSYLDNNGLCNLLNVNTNCLCYSEGRSLDHIYNTYVKNGDFHAL